MGDACLSPEPGAVPGHQGSAVTVTPARKVPISESLWWQSLQWVPPQSVDDSALPPWGSQRWGEAANSDCFDLYRGNPEGSRSRAVLSPASHPLETHSVLLLQLTSQLWITILCLTVTFPASVSIPGVSKFPVESSVKHLRAAEKLSPMQWEFVFWWQSTVSNLW